MNATTDGAHKLITEEIPVAGNELLGRVKALLAEGRVRHIKVKSSTGETYFEVPLAVGVLGGAALAWASPFLAMAGALAGLVTSVKLEVVRDAEASDAMEAGMHAAADKAKEMVTAGAAKAKDMMTAAKGAGNKAKATATKAGRSATGAVKAAAASAKPAAVKAGARTAAKAAQPIAKAAKKATKTVAAKTKTASAKKGR
jgi:hypothetical protein